MAAIRKLLSFFGRFCCGGATKEEDAALEQQPSPPGLVNLFSQDSWSNVKVPKDPWSYGGLLMAPSHDRPVFGYFNNGFFNVAVDPSGYKEPKHDRPVFGYFNNGFFNVAVDPSGLQGAQT
ncbi:hypothetical protein JTE90_002936 [Oedothorax gibbosus]|uniref:Uncharacterized protein n=1 Tax=Oedothorax gibbosus TaxID=931172 RepID=A0AAV6UX53_9ARAC|nr:hypothetical protein JTE90_002936 [Oedothorax gibbosus]